MNARSHGNNRPVSVSWPKVSPPASLLSSNVTLSDSAVEKLLGKRKDIRPTVKEEIPTIKIEDTSLKKAKKPKIVID